MDTATDTLSAVQDDTAWHHLVPRLLSDHGSQIVAEVGVWKGELSSAILKQCHRVTRLILVDPWTVVYGHDPDTDKWMVFGPGTNQREMDESYHSVATRFQSCYDRVTILKMPSVEGAKMVPDRSVDAVLIDALHTYHACKEDILAWVPKVKVGGLMIGDDHSEWFPGVQVAVEELFGTTHRVLGQTWWKLITEEDHVRILRSAH